MKYSRIGIGSLMLLLASIGLIGWIIYLGESLPTSYRADHWNLAWIVFDVVMVGVFLFTSWALWKKRQIAITAAIVSATLLIVDSWFDVITSDPGGDLDLSIVLAIVSVTAAVLLLRFSRRAMRQSILNIYKITGKEFTHVGLWKTPLLMFEQETEIRIERESENKEI